jgi:hypothetical protein
MARKESIFKLVMVMGIVMVQDLKFLLKKNDAKVAHPKSFHKCFQTPWKKCILNLSRKFQILYEVFDVNFKPCISLGHMHSIMKVDVKCNCS